MSEKHHSFGMTINEADAAELTRIDGKPSVHSALPLAFCHVVAMLVGNITPAMLVAASLGLNSAEETTLVQASMIMAGIATLMQLYPVLGCGMNLPTVMGVSFAYVPVLTSIGLAHGLSGIMGAQLVGGAVSIVAGLLIEKIRRFFPPVVTGTVTLAIGLSLYSTAVNYMGGGSAAQEAGTFGSPEFWVLSTVTLAVTLACGIWGKGYVKVSGMIIGILAGFVLGVCMGDGIVDFSGVGSASWLSLPRPLSFGIEFYPDAAVLMGLLSLVQAVQLIGCVSATTVSALDRGAEAGELGGCIRGQGLAMLVGALFGGLPTSTFSQNVGLIGTSKMVSKRIFVIASAIMLADGLSPKFSAIISSIPLPVMGGATVTVFAIIAVSGIEMICEKPLNYRNKIIVGLSLALGVGVGATPEILQFLPTMAQSILGSSVVVSFIVSFVLNIVMPEQDEEDDEQDEAAQAEE